MHQDDYSVNAYQIEARASGQATKSESKKAFLMLGLAGEVGSLLSEIKKQQRDSIRFDKYKWSVIEEFGDCLWYVSALCDELGYSLNEITGVERGLFSEMQPQRSFHFSTPSLSFEYKTLSLFNKASQLSSKVLENDVENAKDCLRGFFRLFVETANETGVQLSDVARQNLIKVADRWPLERVFEIDFDESFPPHERLPNGLIVDMYERNIEGKTYVIQSSGGVFIGDRLTDNIIKGDDYRFHDVFHYAYAAVLGWSPTTRALLKRKRKSKTKIDEGEDSARAVIIEEGVATFIFGQAKKFDFFKGEKPGEMSFALLKQVRQFVEGFEPEKCPLWLWEEAILQGCEAFRFLRENRKARLTVDRALRALRVEELSYDPDAVFG